MTTIKDEIAQDNAKWFPYEDSVMSEREEREYDRERDAKVEMRLLELLEDESFLNDCIINNDEVLRLVRSIVKHIHLNPDANYVTFEENSIAKAVLKELNEYAQKTVD